MIIETQKKTRNRPVEIDYHGMRLYVSPLYKNGVLSQLSISYRFSKAESKLLFGEKKTAPRKKGDGQDEEIETPAAKPPKMFKRVYKPRCETSIREDDPLPTDVIQETLETVMPTLFLPQFFELYPKLRSDNLELNLIGLYVLKRLEHLFGWAPSTTSQKMQSLSVLTR